MILCRAIRCSSSLVAGLQGGPGIAYKFAMPLRLMRRPGNSQPLTHPRRALPDAADWGPARSSLVEGAEPSRIRPVFPGCQRDQLGRWWVTFASRCWRSIGGPYLHLQCRHLGLRLASDCYRLLLIALQLALASNPVHISTTGKMGIPGVPEWLNGEHQAASPGLSGGGRPSVEFG